MPRAWEKRDVQAHKVCLFQQLLFGAVRCPKLLFKLRISIHVRVNNLEVKSIVHSTRESRANATTADNPERFSKNVLTKQKHRAPTMVFASTRKGICLDNAMAEREQKRDCVFGYGFCDLITRSIRNDDAAFFCFCQIDVVESNRVVGNHL